MANKDLNDLDRLDEILFSVAEEANDDIKSELDAIRAAVSDTPIRQRGNFKFSGWARYASIAAALVITVGAALAIFNPQLQFKNSQLAPDMLAAAATDTGSGGYVSFSGVPEHATGSVDAAGSQEFTASTASIPPTNRDANDLGSDADAIILALGMLSAHDLDTLAGLVESGLPNTTIEKRGTEVTADFGNEMQTELTLRFADEDLGYLELAAGEAIIQTVDEVEYLAIWRISDSPAEYLYIVSRAIELEKFKEMLYNIVTG